MGIVLAMGAEPILNRLGTISRPGRDPRVTLMVQRTNRPPARASKTGDLTCDVVRLFKDVPSDRASPERDVDLSRLMTAEGRLRGLNHIVRLGRTIPQGKPDLTSSDVDLKHRLRQIARSPVYEA